jgi:hypothetical protein
MSVILVLATFVVFIVVWRFIHREDVFSSAPRAEAEERKTQPIVAGNEVDRRVSAGIDRRKTDRRTRAA